jgi:hypothetical protein
LIQTLLSVSPLDRHAQVARILADKHVHDN